MQQTLSVSEQANLLKTLKARFEKHENRHPGVQWKDVQARIEQYPEKLRSLNAMEATGGEPDVVGFDSGSGVYTFYDCAAESPKGRRNICYDREALEARKKTRRKTMPWIWRGRWALIF